MPATILFHRPIVWYIKFIVLSLDGAAKKSCRRLLAGTFLILLIAEWGSHVVIEAPAQYGDAPSITASDTKPGDLCDTLILCSDSGRREQQSQDAGRQVIQHNGAPDILSNLHLLIAGRSPDSLDFSCSHGLSRPVSPPFHPPELS